MYKSLLVRLDLFTNKVFTHSVWPTCFTPTAFFTEIDSFTDDLKQTKTQITPRHEYPFLNHWAEILWYHILRNRSKVTFSFRHLKQPLIFHNQIRRTCLDILNWRSVQEPSFVFFYSKSAHVNLTPILYQQKLVHNNWQLRYQIDWA